MTEPKNVPNSSADVPFRSNELRKQSLAQPSSLVGVIDEGTKTIAFSIYTTPDFKEIAAHRVELTAITPQDGWYEQDPLEIMASINVCADEAIKQLSEHGYSASDIATVGITNQRETTIVWDAVTGKPLYNAIVWKDIRTSTTVEQIVAKVQDANHFKQSTGLTIFTYFSVSKIRWLKDNVPEVKRACREKRCKIGTVDSWIIWSLTNGALHITDVTNASRTLLMNIETLSWDPVLLKTFSIHEDMLPEIRSCSEIFGKITSEKSVLRGITLSGILGNQQASLLGQMCVKPGQTKSTYRSGCFLLCNTGDKPVFSRHGLLTTVAYKLGPNAKPIYALEGAVSVAGHTLSWLQHKVRLLSDSNDAEKYAEAVPSSGDVYFVPAFTGLYAPYWRQNARGIIIGLTQFTKKNHIVRAALESICFQTQDILECMHQECGYEINKLHADGKLTTNKLLMQLQADTAGIPVFRSQMQDSVAFGVAMCAAQAEGINLCKFEPEKRYYENVHYDTFLPTTTELERTERYGKWKRAVERSLGWVIKQKKTRGNTEEYYRLLSSLPASIFLISSFAMLVHSLASSAK
ncbi:glycerol kinase [Scaptodrosophila lebanonensis]|uniref:glycerol kinase n=1 Tax=Drosophila lebanonensis TaxID=7225 RepID=A0A6J2TUK7_DROLE|nr:glycerol kinase [Scaptodrosophila lebanonensis]XP_030380247.1 glycerol kinase [Scaptodrosophila lebanonensis]XP_030380248.1 glycerol kinase [Scaptodrosophila lebanonensis]